MSALTDAATRLRARAKVWESPEYDTPDRAQRDRALADLLDAIDAEHHETPDREGFGSTLCSCEPGWEVSPWPCRSDVYVAAVAVAEATP